MSKTPSDARVRAAEAVEASPGGVTSSGEHARIDAVRCAHCPESHPTTYSHCPRTGKPLQTGPALVGRVIAGRYRVTGILGEGGMGAVYIAEHLMLGRKVAIKRLHPELTGDEKAVARFQREARAAAATGHEHIVEVLDLGYAEDGAPYLVMEHLRGASLSQVLKQDGRLGLARTANIVGQVLAALAAVHEREIVHRDLKPDNIFLTRRGGVADYVKVLDFGISKMKHEEGEPTNLTRTGVTMGTPYYMSPEQARGVRKLDHRVDLYAVAVITYECLTGRLPLIGDNYHALLQQILRVDPIPPSSLVPGLPSSLDAVVLRGLAKDPAARFSSAAEMLEALAPFGARVGDVSAMFVTQPASGPGRETRAEASRSDAGRVDVRGPTEAVAATPATSGPGIKSSAPAAISPARQAARRLEPAASPAGSTGSASGSTGSASGSTGSASGSTGSASGSSGSATGSTGSAHGSTGSAAGASAPARGAARGSTAGRSFAPPATTPATTVAPTTGPRYFFAASEDWGSAAERPVRASAGSGPSATTAESGAGTGPSSATSSAPGAPAPRLPSSGERGLPSGPRAASSAEPPSVRETPPSRPARDELAVKGALIAGLLDHLDAEVGSGGAALIVSSLDPALKSKLDGVILPMAWLPLGLFEAILAAVDRDGAEPGRSQGAGRAAAERELSTTHRLFLQTASPATVLDRLPHLHRVYFSRGDARVTPAINGARIDVEGMSAESPALVAWLSGFWQRMLELAGAREVKVIATSARGRGEERTSVTLRWR